MLAMNDVRRMNKKLKELFGQDMQNRANFRVSWSLDQFEWRRGHFEDYYGAIFLRAEDGTRYVPKYQEGACWILERKFWNHMQYDILGKDISYEPIWIFGQDEEDNPRTPTWLQIELIITSLLYGPKGVAKRRILGSAEQLREDEEAFVEILTEQAPHIPDKLKHGEAVVVPSNYQGSR
jgi:hypothetical protein